MKTNLITLLLLFSSGVIALGADRVGFRDATPAKSETSFFHFQVGLLDSTTDPNKQSLPTNDPSELPAEKQYNNYFPDADLFLSISEKFDSSQGQAIVLHLVTQTGSKARQDFQVAKISSCSSLRRLNVMLQV